jgi:hypothetical protein
MIHICKLTVLGYGAISCYSPCWFPFAISPCQFLPFLKSLLLTWNPSSCVVRSRPPWSQVARKLTSPSPFPPHSKFPSPQGIPNLIMRPTKTTSRSQLYMSGTDLISHGNLFREDMNRAFLGGPFMKKKQSRFNVPLI